MQLELNEKELMLMAKALEYYGSQAGDFIKDDVELAMVELTGRKVCGKVLANASLNKCDNFQAIECAFYEASTAFCGIADVDALCEAGKQLPAATEATSSKGKKK